MNSVQSNARCSSLRGDLPQEIPILAASGLPVALLSRLTSPHAISKTIVACMTQWRNTFGSCFLTQFKATEERTEKWLRNLVLPDETRALYLIIDEANEVFGHVGVKNLQANCPEIDNLIRGRRGSDPELMRLAEAALLNAIFKNSRIDSVCLHVFSRNFIAISLHKSLGFEISDKQPLFKKVLGDEFCYVINPDEGEPATFHYLKMRVDRIRFRAAAHDLYGH